MKLSEIIQKKEFLEKELFELTLKGAEAGDAGCMIDLAMMYSIGKGTNIDYCKAVEWDDKAVEYGSSNGKYNKAMTYRMSGDVVTCKQILEEVLVEEDDGEAAFELARLYMVSNKERENVIKYLDMTIKSASVSEGTVEEAQELLQEYK